MQAMNWDGVTPKRKNKIEKDMKALAKIILKHRKTTVPFKTKMMFNMFAAMQKSDMGSGPAEKAYWEKQGWLGKERPWKKS